MHDAKAGGSKSVVVSFSVMYAFSSINCDGHRPNEMEQKVFGTDLSNSLYAYEIISNFVQ